MGEVFQYIAEGIDGSYRLDQYLYDMTEDRSRSSIQAIIMAGACRLNGKTVKKSALVKNGDVIDFEIPETVENELLPENIPLDIIYEDEDVLVVNKPRGMVVHPAPGNWTGTLVNGLIYHIKDLPDIGGVKRPGIVHRIDKDTSGLLMVAKNAMSHVGLSNQLRDRTVGRLYRAIVHGGFKEDEGLIDVPIARSRNNRLMMAPSPDGRLAVTHYRLLEALGKYSILECKLETGRTHQIRVHMRHINHPLVGDPLYGIKGDHYVKYGQLLHAKTLEFDHPRTGERLSFDSELPGEFVKVADELRRKTCT